MSPLLNLLFFISLLNLTHGLKILMMATNIGFSHLQYTGQLSDILVDAGHDVDYFLQVWRRSTTYNGTKKANIIRFEGKNVEKIETIMDNMPLWADAFEADYTTDHLFDFGKIHTIHCGDLLTNHKLLDLLRSKNYTVGIAENFDVCAWAVFRLLNIKSFHQLNAIPLTEQSSFIHGFPFDFRRVPAFQNVNQIGPIKSFKELIRNTYEYFSSKYACTFGLFNPINRLFKELINPNHPTFQEMQRKSAYVWVNTHEFSDFSRAISRKVKNLGGIAVRKPEELNEETSKIFNKAKKGVVLVSFGSVVNTTHMKSSLRDSFLQAFSQFSDYQFIWRLTEVDDNIIKVFNQYPNVHPFKWIQQPSILAHPKTRAFLSHMGLNSFNEAVHFGVPLISLSFFGDQQLNTAIALKQEIAVYLSRREITIETMTKALKEVLENDKYRERSLDIKKKIANSPTNQTDMFIKHVEFAAKFGSLEELELDGAGESLIEQFYLDLIGLALLFIFVVILLIVFVLRKVLKIGRFLSGKSSRKAKKND